MNLIDKARELALEEINRFGTPAITHLDLSAGKAAELARALGANEDIAVVGAYLMDLKLGQAIAENRREEHIVLSAEAADVFLKGLEIEDGLRLKIVHCVLAHHGTIKYQSLEAEICANADCYRFIHPRGMFAYYVLLGKRFSDFDECLKQSEVKLEEKHRIISLDICRQELEPYYQIFKGLIDKARR